MSKTAIAAPAADDFEPLFEAIDKMTVLEFLDFVEALTPLKKHKLSWYGPQGPLAHPADDDCPSYIGKEKKAVIAFQLHLAEHRCTERGIPPGNPGGFAYCDEAMKLFTAQPISEQVVMG